MRIIKRLHLFILKSFLPLFAMTFFIVLFIVLMQFLWRYIDDLVGKGLAMSVIAELFFYAAVSMVPMALPLAILLASLMTFGNLGEKFELTAMKAAGISLVRVMAPLIILISGIAVGAFFFQNDVLPKAQVKMWTLLFSMRQKSPELEIPEGVFYDQIPGINLFVSSKNRDNGMLYDVRIYDVRRGGENVTILVSDSAHMALTGDMEYIYLNMYRGNQYERMATNTTMRNDPFRRESFETKDILIPFDNNFNRLDEGGMREQYVGKNISQLQHTIDSINLRLDSMGYVNRDIVARNVLSTTNFMVANSQAQKKEEEKETKLNFDSIMDALAPTQYNSAVNLAVQNIRQSKNSIVFDSQVVAQEKKIMRRHGIELLKKFTLSVACIIFFFIGAPLGAIIRKGGIGMPLVISVILFLIYYIFDNAGYKMARDGHAAIWVGMWLSTFVLAPLGIFATYKAMNDSAVFDPDKIKLFFRKITGRKEERSVTIKEVIINDINIDDAVDKIHGLTSAVNSLMSKLKGKRFFIDREIKADALNVDKDIEALVDYLHDSRDSKVIELLNHYPILSFRGFTRCSSIKKQLQAVLDTNKKILRRLAPEEVVEDEKSQYELPEGPEELSQSGEETERDMETAQTEEVEKEEADPDKENPEDKGIENEDESGTEN